jgi:peptidoglycan/LPS O-acetylase OafA/YrhL
VDFLQERSSLTEHVEHRLPPADGGTFGRFLPTVASRLNHSRISRHDVVLLDTLRAIAAGLVVLYHARIYALGSSETTGMAAFVYAPTNCGTQAVFWFFVLSGYLVGGSVIAEVASTGCIDLRRYVLSRVSRLYIVLVPALLVTGLFDYWRISTFGMSSNAGFETPASHTVFTFVGNLFFLQTTIVPTFGSNLALWSLANEFWYYLMFPLLFAPVMVAFSARLRLGMFLSGISILAFLSIWNFSIVWLFSLWCLGAVARVVPLRLMSSRPLAICIAIAGAGLFPILHPQIGALATLVVGVTFTNLLLTLRRDVPATGSMPAAWARSFAAFSFSLYIVHLPLQHLMSTALQGRADPFMGLDPLGLEAPTMIVLLASASIAFGYIFSLFTEAHTDALRRRLLGTVAKAS